MHVLLRLLINAAALWVAVELVDGITFTGHPALLLAVALVFGTVNVVLRPLLILLTFPFLIVTLGLFLLVLNAALLWLTGAISESLGLGFRVDGFWPAFLGGLVVSLVSIALAMFVKPDERRT